MKSLLAVIALSFVSTAAFAQDASVSKYYNLLNAENKAKASLGKIAKIVLVEKDAVKTKKRHSKIGTSSSTASQALVDSRSCTAGLYVESLNLGSSSDCNGNETTYLRNANVAVEMNFSTFEFDLTEVTVQLYAQDAYDSYLVVDDLFTIESDAFGSGANTVVYVVDSSYAYNYSIFADVYLDDERGTACVITTNSAVIE